VYDDAVVDVVAHAGYSPDFGARPIKRAIQTLIENPLAKQILAGGFVDGDRIVLSKDGKGELVIEKKPIIGS
jgi:ATP-dependent Clp protease ATP-binding subunit ClpB